MPDPIVSDTGTDLIASADAAAERLAAQARSASPASTPAPAAPRTPAPGSDVKPQVDPARGDELDATFRELTETKVDPANPPKDTSAPAPAAEPDPAPATPPSAPSEAAPAKPSSLLDEESTTEPAKPAAAPVPEAGKDPYDDVKLRSDASPRTQETFQNLKNLARQRESELQTKLDEQLRQIEEANKRLQEIEAKSKELPEDVKKELEDLRGFRAQFDTENDPSFRAKYDERISANETAVYQRLASHGLPDSEIAKLKAMPESERISVLSETLLPKLPADSRFFVEAKLRDNVVARDARQQELQQTRANADKVLASRQQEQVQAQQKRDEEVVSFIKPVLARSPFFHAQEIPASATPSQRREIEAANRFALEAQTMLRNALVDDSPKARAEAAFAVPYAHYLKQQLATTSARLKEVEAELDAIQKASATSRASRSIASTASTPAPKAEPKNSGDAVDSLFAEATGGKPTR